MNKFGMRSIGFILGFAFMMGLPLGVYAQGDVDIVGSWNFTVSAAEGERQVVVAFKKENDKLLGLLTTSRGEVPFQSVVVKGEDIDLALKLTINDQESNFTFKGKVQGNTMKGDAELGPYGKGTWTATKRAEASTASTEGANLSGAWKFAFETPNGQQLADFTFTQETDKLTGTGKSSLGETPVVGTIKGKKVEFSFQVNYQGELMKIKCSGDIESETAMNGSFTYNDQGPGTWKAKKQ